jgi:hypothetical protein
MAFAGTAWAQPRWGRDRVPSDGACFYEDKDFHGDYFCVRQGDRLESLPSDMGDRISSLRVFGNAEVTVFRDKNLNGRSARFLGDVNNLKGEGWNDQISSVEIAGARDYGAFGGWGRGHGRNGNGHGNGNGNGNGNAARWENDREPVWTSDGRLPQEGACFYEDKDFRGRFFCAPRGATYSSLPSGFNDKISSVRVFGGEVVMFNDKKFHGKATQIRNDMPNLKGNMRDKVSSIRVF